MITQTPVETVTYLHHGRPVPYKVWPVRVLQLGGPSLLYRWEALGRTDQEFSKSAAHDRARRWIRDGQ